MSRSKKQRRADAEVLDSVTPEKVVEYLGGQGPTPIIARAHRMNQQIGHYHALLARGERDLATGATIAACVTALQIAAAQTTSALEQRLKLELLTCLVLPCLSGLRRRDVSRMIEAVLRRDRDQSAEAGIPFPSGDLPLLRASDGAVSDGGRDEKGGRWPNRRAYEVSVDLCGTSELVAIWASGAHMKAVRLRSEGRTRAADAADATFSTLLSTLCVLPTTNAEPAGHKVETLSEVLPDLCRISGDLAEIVSTTLDIEREGTRPAS